MNRQITLMVVLCPLLIQGLSSFAQTQKIPGTNIYFKIPNDKWVQKVNDKSGRGAMYAWLRETVAGENSKPSIAFITEELTEPIRVIDYASQKRKQAKITTFYDPSDNLDKKFGLVNGMLWKGYLGSDSLYYGVVVNGLKAVMVVCSVNGKSFEKYDEEFLSLLTSLSYSSTGNANAAGKTGVTANASTAKPAITEKASFDACSYFPVVNRMKFAYKRNDNAGEHIITETYTSVADKTLKSGRVIKGYKINTTVANRNNSVLYYYCDNSSRKMCSEMPNYDTHIKEYVEDYSVLPSDYNKPDYQKTPIWETEKSGSGKYLYFTELKAGNVGTSWTDRQEVNENMVTITSKIVETGLTLTVQGKSYSPVIHVVRSVTINFLGEDQNLNTQDIYYAKDIGKIKVIEKGNGVLGGSFTTTQELVNYSIPGGAK